MHIYLPIIAYNQDVNGYYMTCLIELVILLKQKNYDISIDPIYFESLIPRGRNAAAARFINNSKATHLIFIDTDIVFSAKDILKLIEADLSVIGGVYPKKYLKENTAKYPVDFTVNGSVFNTQTPEILEAEYVPTGFMCIKKETLLTIIEKNKDIEYINNIDAYTTETNIFHDFFRCVINPETKHYLSEDYSFCELCKKSEIKVYIYTNITLKHIGKHMYTGNLQEYLDILS
jgi:hypothetical protein